MPKPSSSFLLLVVTVIFIFLAGCGSEITDDLEKRVNEYAKTEITGDVDNLNISEQAVLEKLVDASKIMHSIFIAQACPDYFEIRSEIEASNSEFVLSYFDINVGPWDRRLHFEPFYSDRPHPEGANYYPLDLTIEEKALINDSANGFDGLFTMIRRNENGNLVAIPYSEFFNEELTEAAKLLNEAADLSDNVSLADFLRSRAKAFMSDDYFESDMLWMDIDSKVEVTIGPYETYEDGLFGYKAAFESFVTIVDPVESAKLDKYKNELPWFESELPILDKYKNPNRGSESPIRVVDEVYTAGDTRSAVQTIAFNLPNDERVREAKGSKKVLLRNVMNAKFEQILTPIASKLLVPDQAEDIAAESFFMHTLFHEMSHGLGPGIIEIDGRKTEVRLELKELYSALEEAKADAMGPWCIFKLQPKGYFPESIYRQQAVTFLAGLFRSVRFGIAEAHGSANAMQFNYLLERDVISVDEGLFSIDVDAFPGALEELISEILTIQAEGNYESAKAFSNKYSVMPECLATGLAQLDGVPVDLLPMYRWSK
jgi:hypothetical protein